MQNIKQNNHGIAIILVISILAVLASLGAAFSISARLEAVKTVNFKEGMKGTYVAEAGLAHAKGLLKQDKQATTLDTNNESWRTTFLGSDVDNDDDGIPEAKWINVVDEGGGLLGRYAITITDETSRVNINTAGYHNENALKVTEGYSPFEISLNKLFTALGLAQADTMRDDILLYRYGGNYPGSSSVAADDNNNNIYFSNDGIDNNANGVIDEESEGVNEPQEFVSYFPYGDDRPFFSIFELENIPSIKSQFSQIKPFVTAYSFDYNADKDRILRLDLNQATVLELKNVFSSSDLTEQEQLAVNIVDYRDSDNESSVIVSDDKTYYGVEGIRINEIMIDPRYGYAATTLTNGSGPGGGWTLAGGYYENSNPTLDEFGRGIWYFGNLRPGTYYLRVHGAAEGDIVGDVKVGGVTHASMGHGEMFVNPVVVGADGKLDITIYNKEVDRGEDFTVYFKEFRLFESPDAEYIELINITNKDIDVSGWTLEGLRENDLVGIIPLGTVIKSFDYLVCSVDKDDTGVTVPINLQNNGISFLHTWSGAPVHADDVVQLTFSAAISREDDIIYNYPQTYNTVLLLKTSDRRIVDRVEYFSNYPSAISFERGDPASTRDRDNDFIFDDWVRSLGFPFFLPVGSPTKQNNNLSISGHIVGGMNSEVLVKNGDLANVGELFHVSAGDNWQSITSADLMLFCDQVTTMSYRYEAETHFKEGNGWQEISRSSPYTNWFSSSTSGDTGVWHYTANDRLLDGIYVMTLYGQSGETFSVSLKRNDESWTDFTPPLTPDINNSVRYGIIDVGGSSPNALPSKTIEIQIKNESASGQCHFDYLIFSPVNRVDGRININTASEEVLQALPGVSGEVATNIVANRPFGSSYGIGDILSGDTLATNESGKKEIFREICNLITVKSDIFEILITAQSFLKGKRTSEKKLQVIVER
ncbi:MAG: helix-hairpin-helix domain-containing protein [Candidatus Omnitrophota bacterium]